MPLSLEQKTKLQGLHKKSLAAGNGKGPMLTEQEREWLDKATGALLSDETIEDPPVEQPKKAAPVKPAAVEQVEAEAIEEQVNAPNTDMSVQEALERVNEMREALLEMADAQGTGNAIRKVMRDYPPGDVYLIKMRGIVIAFRPLYASDAAELNKIPEAEADEWVTRRCVLAGLDKLAPEGRARLGLFATIAMQILRVSDSELDGDVIIPATGY